MRMWPRVTISQGWEFALSLFTFRSKSLILKSDCERFALSDHEYIAPVALYKRATISNSLPLLFNKSNGIDALFFMSESHFGSQKTSDSLEKP